MSPRATALAVLTLVGLSVLPALHLIFHDQLEPHEHGPRAGHCHGGECHEHDESADADGADEGETPADHGEGSLAHQDFALGVAPPALPPIGVSRLAVPAELPAPCLVVAREHDRPSRARGPPLSS